jgi:transposase InsO family protein
VLNEHEPFESIDDAQAAVDAWRKDYNADRPHQSLAMAFPAARFAPATGEVFGLRVPASLAAARPAEPATSMAGPGEPVVAAAAGNI